MEDKKQIEAIKGETAYGLMQFGKELPKWFNDDFEAGNINYQDDSFIIHLMQGDVLVGPADYIVNHHGKLSRMTEGEFREWTSGL